VHRAAAPVLVAALLLTACGTGGSTGSDLPTVGASTTTVAPTTGAATSPTTSTPAPDASPWTALPTISEGPNKGVHSGVVLASSVAKTDDEKAAVDAFVAFWEVLVATGADARASDVAIDEVAQGVAASNLAEYAKTLRRRNARTVGWVSIKVTSVKVGASGALMRACLDNGTFDVNAKTGAALEKIPPAFDVDAGVRSQRGSWRVSSAQSSRRKSACS